jgi:uncharacterized protein
MSDYWFQTRTGKRIDVNDPNPELVDIKDIAGALSHMPRWGGHTNAFYSIAEHGVRLAQLVPPDLRMVALLKDAAKAYVGELQRPVKRLPAMEGWRSLRDRWALAIGTAFRLGQRLRFPDRLIREYDERLNHAERISLFGPGDERERANITQAKVAGAIVAMSPDDAYTRFLQVYAEAHDYTVFE